jgi:putative DNA primase/helicase
MITPILESANGANTTPPPQENTRSINTTTAISLTQDEPPPSATITSFQELLDYVAGIDPPPLLELTEKYLRIESNSLGTDLTAKQYAIITVEHLKHVIDAHGWGLSYLEGTPRIFLRTHWQEISEETCGRLLATLAECLRVPTSVFRDCDFRNRMLRQFRMEFTSSETPKASDEGKILINLRNGTLEFNDGVPTLREFRKEDHCRYQLAFDYDPDASCPTFHKFLERVQPDEDAREVLAEFMGWCFLKDLKLEKALLLYGTGSNGKSAFFEVMCAMLGPQNVSHLDLSALMKPEGRFPLGSSLLNFCSELGGRVQSSVFKRLASGEPIPARLLYKNVHTMRDYAKLAFNTNVLPKAEEMTDGFTRRFLIVPFPIVIPQAEVDPDLARKIIADELPGVLNWVIEGMLRLNQNRRFTECASATAAIQDYIQENDSVAIFLEELGLKKSNDGKIGKLALYQGYIQFCRSSGLPALEKNAFGKQLLEKHGIRDGKSGSKRYWRLKRVTDEATAKISFSL